MSAAVKTPALYQERLLEHFHHPRNKGETAHLAAVARGSNPLCGDEVEVGVSLEAGRLRAVRFRGHGCAVCIASASMMTEAVSGLDSAAALALRSRLEAWLDAPPTGEPPDLPEPLPALEPVQSQAARRRCVLLAWEALEEALARL